MQLLAEAMKLLAEATLKVSEAIDKMARRRWNEERQIQLLELIHTQININTI